jgi:antitoxin component YwqK of YwqJK toxin-antitoxin module
MSLCYKSCSVEWIVVMKKLIDTITNEERESVKNKLFAKHRANKLLVIEIRNKYNKTNIKEIFSSCYKKKIKYIVGEIIEEEFDKNINNVCSAGIHYFLSEERAFHYERKEHYTGVYKMWKDDGRIFGKCMFNNGIFEGQCIEYHKNGKKKAEYEYKKNKINGLYIEWYDNGYIKIICICENGVLNGLYNEWYPSGSRKNAYTYNMGNFVCTYEKWFDIRKIDEYKKMYSDYY